MQLWRMHLKLKNRHEALNILDGVLQDHKHSPNSKIYISTLIKKAKTYSILQQDDKNKALEICHRLCTTEGSAEVIELSDTLQVEIGNVLMESISQEKNETSEEIKDENEPSLPKRSMVANFLKTHPGFMETFMALCHLAQQKRSSGALHENMPRVALVDKCEGLKRPNWQYPRKN